MESNKKCEKSRKIHDQVSALQSETPEEEILTGGGGEVSSNLHTESSGQTTEELLNTSFFKINRKIPSLDI